MPGKIKMEVVTPEGVFLDKEVEEVIVPGGEGDYGVLVGHIPMLTFIRPGILSYQEHYVFFKIAVGRGFCEVIKDRVTVLVEEAYTVEQIDLAEATTEAAELEDRLLAMDPWTNSREYRQVLSRFNLAKAKVSLASQ